MPQMRASRILAALVLGAFLLPARSPAQDLTVLASGLRAPVKVSLTPAGSLLVCEAGAGPSTGRISLVRRDGTRITILDGLPSGLSAVGDNAPSGPSGIVGTEGGGDHWTRRSAGPSFLPASLKAAPAVEAGASSSSTWTSLTAMLTSVTCSPVIRSTDEMTLRRMPEARSAMDTP